MLHKINRSQFSSIRFLDFVTYAVYFFVRLFVRSFYFGFFFVYLNTAIQQLQQYHQWRQPWWFPLLHPWQLVNAAGSSSATANVLARSNSDVAATFCSCFKGITKATSLFSKATRNNKSHRGKPATGNLAFGSIKGSNQNGIKHQIQRRLVRLQLSTS